MKLIKVFGTVQGVGFRPFVYKLAKEQQLRGYVLNDSEGVKIHLQCDDSQLDIFCEKLKASAPPRAIIQQISTAEYFDTEMFKDFQIKFSETTDSRITQISPDLDVCDDCLREVFDENNPRYLYPFINCTNCGPRFTITQDIPYDRKNTTMSQFQMCPECQSEYEDPENRRFHAQPNGCHHCGPELELTGQTGNRILSGNGADTVQEIFRRITEFINAGKIIAIKGIGGFHLSCDALNETAVSRLRKRKYREDKPFAVMFKNIEQVREFCEILPHEAELLTSFQHPIVLLKNIHPVADSVAPGNQYLGCMLPYSPVHHILMRFNANPLVMTSGNISDEPVKFSNESALKHLCGIADYFLLNNRDINIRCDDSVVRSYNKKLYPLRRSRGYVPVDLNLNYQFTNNILACGAEQKNVFALAKNDKIYLSHHIGDLKNYEVLQAFESGVQHFENIFDIQPQIIAVDKHPDYLSTNFGKEYAAQKNLKLVKVQHHHAHAVSCMAENGLNEKVIALVLDGTGYGNDGKIWGGECLVCDYRSFERVGHFREVQMPGGDNAIKNISAMGLAYLYEVFGSEIQNFNLPFMKKIKNKELLLQMLEKNINSPVTTSCGRLFDGVAAICGFRDTVNYEGQAAIEFEQQISHSAKDHYDFRLNQIDGCWIIDWEMMLRQLLADIEKNINYSIMSEKFHRGLAEVFVRLIKKVGEKHKINKIVLSGGVFMNIFLLKTLGNKLLSDNFTVYTHSELPTNDGGIALGQLLIADNQF